MLRGHGRTRRTGPGEVLIQEGQRDRDFIVVLAGTVAVHERYGTEYQQLVRVHGPGRFLDEIGLLTGQPALVSSVVDEPGEVIEVHIVTMGHLAALDPALGDLILRAFICRSNSLITTRR
jgi:thioredoxin reductase (NADPH)